jgi:hypothetical protein
MMRNLKSYEAFLLEGDESSKSVVSLVKKVVSEKLRTEVDYTDSSKVFTMKGLVLVYPKVLENILKEEGIKAINISKPVKGQIAGDTTFKIESK